MSQTPHRTPKPPRDPAHDLPLIEKKIGESRGFRLVRIQRALQYSRYLHFKNYGDIAPLLTPISKPEVIKQLLRPGSDNIKHFILELIRRLVNYLNASCYLVDHTRFLMGKAYARTDPLRREIEARIDATYFGADIPELVRGLRHTGSHVTLPMVTLTFSFERGEFGARLNLAAWQEEARTWKKLPKAREYLAAQKEDPLLGPILARYHALDAQFFQWLGQRQHETHKGDFEELAQLQKDLRDKYAECGINPDELTSLTL